MGAGLPRYYDKGANNMLKVYSGFLNLLEKLERIVLVVTVPTMVLVMVYQVILRYIFNNPNSWSDELASYLFIFNVMLASAIAIRRNSHLQIDILINLLRPKTRRVFTIVATLIGIVFLVLLLRYSIDLCTTGARNITPGLGIPMSIPYASIPIGTVLMILTSLEVVVKNVQELITGKEASA